jgi:hypothetical protein
LFSTERQEVINTQNGRLGPGSAYHCFHKDGSVSTQTILEWLPLEQLTTEDTSPVQAATLLFNLQISPTSTGTHLRLASSQARGSWLPRTIFNIFWKSRLQVGAQKGVDIFVRRIQDELESGALELPAYFDPDHGHEGHAHD